MFRCRILFNIIAFSFLISTFSSNPKTLQVDNTGMSLSTSSSSMPVLAVRSSEVAHPTGDPNFSVMQPFPAAFTAEESDPFLMCDSFGPAVSKGIETDPDKFQVAWHPHRGMDILTYLTEGVGRHADSLGNRGNFASPGMQWISVGSGIEHAEGGGTPAGQSMQGFQIWVNVPSARKMDDPRYGTEPPENIPVVSFGSGEGAPAGFARVLAGELGGQTGPFQTVQPVQIADYTLSERSEVTHTVTDGLDNCLVFVYKGAVSIGAHTATQYQCVRLDAHSAARSFTVRTTAGASFMVFAGKMLHQPIAWHGPFVMTTDTEIRQTLREYSQGTFLKKRAEWDYKRIATKPLQA